MFVKWFLFFQIAYDQSGRGALFKRHVSFVLGLWHPVKHLFEKIWQRFFPFVATLLHFLMPGCKAMYKVRLPKMTELFTLLRLAANAALLKLLQSVIDDPNVLVASKSWASNLLDLLQYFIPVVSQLICDLHRCLDWQDDERRGMFLIFLGGGR